MNIASAFRIPVSAFVTLLALCVASDIAHAEAQSVDNFSTSAIGGFPNGWDTYPFQMGKAKKVYRIEQEGAKNFLRAIDQAQLSTTIFREFDWDMAKFPYLKFKWRAQQLPQAGMQDNHPVNDHACGVYVDFGRSRALKYVWSSAMQPDSYWAKKPGQFVVVSKQYGSAAAGQWHSVSVNVPADFQKYFDEAANKNPSGIGLLTDADNTKGSAACDYGDFEISNQP